MIDIRPYSVKDYKSFAKFISHLDSEKHFILYDPDERQMDASKAKSFLTRISKSDNSIIFFAINQENDIVGFICGEVSGLKRISHIMRANVAVLKKYHHCGIGKLLAKSLLEFASEKMISRIEISIIKNNVASLNLAKHYKFNIEGTKKRSIKINGIYYDEYILSKLLS